MSDNRVSTEYHYDNNNNDNSVLEEDGPDINSTKSFEIARTTQEIKQKGKGLDMDEHSITLDELFTRFETSREEGLSDAKYKEVLARDGPNKLQPPPQTPNLIKFLEHLLGGFALLLWVGAFLCFIGYMLNSADQSNLYLGVVLVAVVVITAVFSYYQDSKAAKVMDKFSKMIPQTANILRNGENQTVDASQLVVGDIVFVKFGEKCPADLRILECSGLKVDNSSLTGESEPQLRDPECTAPDQPLETKNLAFFSTSILTGTGVGVVVNTGDRTIIGRIANLASTTANDETPIRKEIHHFIKIISTIAIILGIIFFIFGLPVYDFITNVVFVIGIIVANVPEGLLATVTVALTLTSKRMASKKVLVKNLESVETLGSTTTICSDKTGTLTQNRMTVVHLWVDGTIHTTETATQKASFDKNSEAFQAILRTQGICNNATFKYTDDRDNAKKIKLASRETNGDGSESAMIKFVHPIRDIYEFRKSFPKQCEIPFNSANKYQVSVHKQEGDDPRLLLVMKGAPERILSRCDTILWNGEEIELDASIKEKYAEASSELTGQGERVLGHCQYYLPEDEFPPDHVFDQNDPDVPLEGLCFVGLTALQDPPRKAVPGAIEKCQEAKIKVIMVTGDHPDTAKAIAQQVGIIKGEAKTKKDIAKERGCDIDEVQEDEATAIVITGTQLKEMSDEELDNVLKKEYIVFARTSPEQKLRIVEGCQKRKEIVAVTGDGVNDSPALKKADIGVAMGITGSEVSKEAADMILLDDNFASIVKGVEEGRLIFDNLKKSIAYTLSSNIPEITPFILFIVIQIPLPLSTVLILCVDLGTDLIPAISLAYEKSESDIMKRPPRDAQRDKLVTGKLMSFAYLQIGVIQASAGMFTYFVVMGDFGFNPLHLPFTSQCFDAIEELTCDVAEVNHKSYDERINAIANAQTAYFVSIVVVQWADLLICKTRKLSLFKQGLRNKMLNFGLFSETLLALVIMYLPFLDIALGTRPLSPRHWLPALPFSLYILCYDEMRKFWIRSNPSGWVFTNTYY
eukprot:TRINITY_DN2011_c0_g1_i1.p1 TRINITY_DN2011_c0_g1~~TRINITY_DN2011_c0_g1_i1.p1  ORF type:complete len:1031 (-),score=418.97 TRINITY_DN2011_c0_g1_i1:329-3421(-)